jgi:uncharacterized protein (DUF1778 family)
LTARVSDRIGDAALLRVDEVHHTIALFPADRAGIKAATRARRTPVRDHSRTAVDVLSARMSMSYTTRSSIMSSSVLSVRLSEEERALLEAASSQARTNVSDFVRRKALEAAEVDMLERRIVTIPAKDWERFEAWAAKPAREIPQLKDLARRPPTWRK